MLSAGISLAARKAFDTRLIDLVFEAQQVDDFGAISNRRESALGIRARRERNNASVCLTL